MKFTSFIFISLCTVHAVGQTVSGPMLGMTIAQDGRSVRPIYGIPGASRLGDPVALPDDLRNVKLNPASNVAFALAGDAGTPTILDLVTLTRTALDQARPQPDVAVWSPSGSALALVYRHAQWVQIYTVQSGTFQLSSEYSAVAHHAAVSDDGSALLTTAQNGLSLYQSGGASVLSANHVSSFTFLAGGAVPAFWTGGQLTIGGQTLPLALDDGDSLFLASPGSGRLVAVRANAGRVTTFDAAGQMIDDSGCNCVVSGIEALARAGSTWLRTSGDGPMWIADTASAPRVFFVPAAIQQVVDSEQ
jgi:hypothetical protein